MKLNFSFNRDYLYKSLSATAIENIVTGMLALAASYILITILAKETYGQYQYVLAIVSILTIFTLRGSGESIVRNTAHGQYTLRQNILTFLRYGLPATLLGIGVSLYYLVFDSRVFGAAILLASLSFVLAAAFNLYSAYWIGIKDFKTKATLHILSQAGISGSLVITALYTNNIWLLIAVYFLSQIGVGLILTRYTLIHEPTTESVSAATDSGYKKHISINTSIQDVSKKIDKIIVFSFLGAEALAAYVVAHLPLREFNRLPVMLRQILFPKLYDYTYKQVLADIPRKVVFVFVPIAFLIGIYTLIAPTLFTILFLDYPEVILLTQLAALRLLFTPNFIFNQTLIAFDKTKELYIINTVTACCSAALLLTGALLGGLLGVIVARVIVPAIRSTLLVFFFLREKRLLQQVSQPE